jgi:hypothetical protein
MQTLAAAPSPISTIPSSIKNIQKRKKNDKEGNFGIINDLLGVKEQMYGYRV